MARVVKKLLEAGANPALQTPPVETPVTKVSSKKAIESTNPFDDDDENAADRPSEESVSSDVGLLTPLHLAVASGFEDVVSAFVEHSEYWAFS